MLNFRDLPKRLQLGLQLMIIAWPWVIALLATCVVFASIDLTIDLGALSPIHDVVDHTPRIVIGRPFVSFELVTLLILIAVLPFVPFVTDFNIGTNGLTFRFNAGRTARAGARAASGIESAAETVELPPLDLGDLEL